ncbi:hypothetical protein ceV_263 [Chrysochromulina ericina virus CeV-01B]|uniref:Uncharacterized protein n=1 Tax=Chrysochromulina ericina virus CeV-01B TaxID=3070830 RepID=A0A0N7G7M1_9VIRU|nr:hypothetical protein ceV_263 [Chrysochromulina ericina virus]ALH23169.1 hypothetical protein ceV_263 [Chrysochromulina ericina virus CeV-01B]
METQDFFLLNDQDNYKIHETLVIMSNNTYSNIISQINMNYLLIILYNWMCN